MLKLFNKYKNYIESILGTILITLSLDLFISPMNIVTGGTGGLTVIVKAITNMSTTTFITLFYLLMLLINYLVFGFGETKKFLIFSILYPLFTRIFVNLSLVIRFNYEENKLVLYLFCAILTGIGNGLIYKNGFIAGGTDVIKKILSSKLHIQMGISTFICDSFIVLIGSFIFGLNSLIYAIIIIYISSAMTDRLILGISKKKMFYIFTNKDAEIRNCIKCEFGRGITEIEGKGGYNTKMHILMSVVDTSTYIKLKERINEIDNSAFMIIIDSYHYYHGR